MEETYLEKKCKKTKATVFMYHNDRQSEHFVGIVDTGETWGDDAGGVHKDETVIIHYGNFIHYGSPFPYVVMSDIINYLEKNKGIKRKHEYLDGMHGNIVLADRFYGYKNLARFLWRCNEIVINQLKEHCHGDITRCTCE